MNKKIIGLLSVLIFILLILWSYNSLYNSKVVDNVNTNISNKPEEIDTSDWVEYKNEELGFEFQYPSDLILQTKGLNEVSIIFPNKDNLPLAIDLAKVDIFKYDNNDTKYFVESGKIFLSQSWIDELGVEKEVPENNISNGGNVIIFLGPLSPPSNIVSKVYVVISNGNNDIVLSGVISGGSISTIVDTIEKISMTVTFIE